MITKKTKQIKPIDNFIEYLSKELKIPKFQIKIKRSETEEHKVWQHPYYKTKNITWLSQPALAQVCEKYKIKPRPILILISKHVETNYLQIELKVRYYNQIKVDNEYLDFFIPTLNLAIRLDKASQICFDINNQKIIEKKLKCCFLQINS